MQSLEIQLPRIFQANIVRLYDRVVRPGMALLTVHSELVFGVASVTNACLERAAAQVDNYTANEAAKAYALTVAAVFERQLRTWARSIVASSAVPPLGENARYEALLDLCATYAGLDLQRLGVAADLTELLLVGNVVRHGEGRSCNKLRRLAPTLWNYEPSEYVDIVTDSPPVSELMRIREADLARYARAAGRFWGHADPLPMPAREVPI
jgi:hypothetical protein